MPVVTDGVGCLGIGPSSQCATKTGRLCSPCLLGARRQKRRRHLIAIVAIVITASLVATLFLTLRRDSDRTDQVKNPVAADSLEMIKLRRKMTKECDSSAVVKLGSRLMKRYRYEEAISVGAEYQSRCGRVHGLGWVTFSSYRSLGQWTNALVASGEMIHERPHDSDYWWWRGEVLARDGDHASALADYRQSIANSNMVNQSRFAIARIIEVARESGHDCEAYYAITYVRDEHRGKLDGELTGAIRWTDRDHKCTERISGSPTVIPVSRTDNRAEMDVSIGSATGRFAIDRKCGTTVITQSMANRAGVPVHQESVETFGIGEIRSGARGDVAELSFGKLKASKLQVVVVDELEEGLDGVLCFNVLGRFRSRYSEDGDVFSVPEK